MTFIHNRTLRDVKPAIHYQACLPYMPDTLKRTHSVHACLSGLSVKHDKEND